MYSRIIAEVRKEENGVYILLIVVLTAAVVFREHANLILGDAGVFLLFEIMIRLQAIIKILKKDEE